ncbi:PREDICTED: putative E3 ubiquitin-protein ligase SINA-like 6 [Prunus mume]|uniref:RING-type E3 ubiquitin transferase n=1 Tax=Prunus mume TaxID=102107 RepID=A0ABM0NSV7_PRUMU|nr:PREDICTED: putative E3 ubiquitin-protein ligase SINA-like 6 [Prunus mume]
MARFALGGDEDGEGEGSRIPRPKKPRLAPNLLPQYPAARIAIIEQQPQQPPQPQSQQLRTVEEDEEADEESEGEEMESEGEVEADEESEEEDEDEEEEDEEGEEEITVGCLQQVGNSGHVSELRIIDLLRQNRTAPANPKVGSASASLTSNAGVQEGSPPPISPVTDGSLVFTLADPEVLDCLICYEPLTIPVFQCENGHIACSSCCTKIKNKCPSCSWPIGYNRCRAIEKILESIRISCQNIKHGCKEMVTYNKKNEHEKACVYSPCSCPLSGCNFISSSKQLYLHFTVSHVDYATRFLYGINFSITLNIKDKFLVLQEKREGILFILDNHAEKLGNLVSLCCIQPIFKGGFYYDLLAKTNESSLRFQSFTKNSAGQVISPSSTGYFIIPSDFFSSGKLHMDLCIWRNGQCPASFQSIDVA